MASPQPLSSDLSGTPENLACAIAVASPLSYDRITWTPTCSQHTGNSVFGASFCCVTPAHTLHHCSAPFNIFNISCIFPTKKCLSRLEWKLSELPKAIVLSNWTQSCFVSFVAFLNVTPSICFASAGSQQLRIKNYATQEQIFWPCFLLVLLYGI